MNSIIDAEYRLSVLQANVEDASISLWRDDVAVLSESQMAQRTEHIVAATSNLLTGLCRARRDGVGVEAFNASHATLNVATARISNAVPDDNSKRLKKALRAVEVCRDVASILAGGCGYPDDVETLMTALRKNHPAVHKAVSDAVHDPWPYGDAISIDAETKAA